MWKKNEPEPARQRPFNPLQPGKSEARREQATIGPSISVKGDLTGEEDLLIQGRIQGKIVLKQHSVTVGKSGRVKADIHGSSIRIEGEVEGNLYGQQDIVIRASGRVLGNLTAPRVTLENGSKFKGAIDMQPDREPVPGKVTKKTSPPASGEQKQADLPRAQPRQAEEPLGRTAG